MTLRLAIVACLVIATVGSARADNVAGAKEHYGEATKRYNLGDYGAALEGFKAAYLALPDPAFLFNIAQCERQLGQYDAAAKSYRAFLRESHDAPPQQRDEVQRLITEMDQAAREAKARQEQPPIGTQPPHVELAPRDVPAEPTSAAPTPPPTVEVTKTPTTRRPWYKHPAGWGVLGAGAVVVGVGGGLLGASSALYSDAVHATDLAAQRSDNNQSRTYQSAGLAMISVGAVAVVAGAIVLAVQARRSR